MKKFVYSSITVIALFFTALTISSCQKDESPKDLLLKQLELENIGIPLNESISFHIYDPNLRDVTNIRPWYKTEPIGAIGEHVNIAFLSEMGQIWYLSLVSSDITSYEAGYSVIPQKAKLIDATSSWAPSNDDLFNVNIKGDITVKNINDDCLVLRFSKVIVPSIYGNKDDDFIFNGDLEINLKCKQPVD